MQSDLLPSCKLDTDSAQPCLDNMFFSCIIHPFLVFCYCENGSSSDSHTSDLVVFFSDSSVSLSRIFTELGNSSMCCVAS